MHTATCYLGHLRLFCVIRVNVIRANAGGGKVTEPFLPSDQISTLSQGEMTTG